MTKPTKLAAVSGDTNAAVLSERLRVSAILLESPEGRRNPNMANQLALRTTLDAETARSILAQAPSSNPYLDAMSRQGPINIGDGIGANVETFSNDPKAARLKEIEQSVGVFNESRGPGKSRTRKNGYRFSSEPIALPTLSLALPMASFATPAACVKA